MDLNILEYYNLSTILADWLDNNFWESILPLFFFLTALFFSHIINHQTQNRVPLEKKESGNELTNFPGKQKVTKEVATEQITIMRRPSTTTLDQLNQAVSVAIPPPS